MAKATKSGLGRGLNSLLGDPSDDEVVAPSPARPTRQRVVVEPGEIPAYDPILEPRDVSRETIEVREREVEKIKAEETSSENVTIKSIVSRNVDEVPIDWVSPNPDQPRTFFKKEEIEELAASIKQDGLLQPILVRTLGKNEYQIIAGERRWQACKSLGVEKIPIRIKDVDDDRALELALVENVQRSDLNPIEEAYGYRRLMERKNMTQSDVAQAMSKGRSTVANALRLLELPQDAQKLLFEEKITAGHARAILSVPSKEGRQKITEKLMEERLSVRETEALARLLAGRPKADDMPVRQPLPDAYKKVAKALRDVLKTNVRVKSSKGKNKIEIEFKDEEELSRLFEELLASMS
ncbi:MAG: ParB/RepB/Spo0J family partition protein [Eggerthellaceae bacterium]|nr:ParB/RepB/Spo0J family partition protein [Eggerthellaceae bacterium]